MQEVNKYQATFKHSMRIGQTVFIISANRAGKCKQCGITGYWKYYVKKTKITSIGFHLGINGSQEVTYYYKSGNDNWCHFNDTIIYLTKADAQAACDIENPPGKE